jgi:hypothetical protein
VGWGFLFLFLFLFRWKLQAVKALLVPCQDSLVRNNVTETKLKDEGVLTVTDKVSKRNDCL